MSQINLTDQEQAVLVSLLAKMEPGFYPYPIFKEFARLVVLPIVEFVPLRIKDGKTEILLIPRDQTDDIWPGELHTPGTVVRPTDDESDSSGAFRRILEDELMGTSVSEPQYVGSRYHRGKRGGEQSQIYWVEVLGEPAQGAFYDANNLPQNLMEQQITFIKEAIRSFEAVKFNKA